MAGPKLTKLELRIMEALWTRGQASIREIQETFPANGRPAYTTIQTVVYRLEGKNAVRRVKKWATSIFLKRRFPPYRSTEADRRPAGTVRWAHPTRHGAPDRIRQADARGC